jgi:GDPmannose 4,6-dehydratase
MKRKKIALIFGITGQDGSYLAKFLLKKNYIVHGVKRRSSIINTLRIDSIYQENQKKNKNLYLHYGDLTDALSILNIIKQTKPDEIYNLAAQSHVAVSFLNPQYTLSVNAIGTLNILEAIRLNGKKIKFYQAGTSEMFGGDINKKKQDEKTEFYPKSPYGVSKVFAHWITKNYRETYKIFACNGILFNHESPLRGETFVTQKIVNGLMSIKKNECKKLYLGNIYSKRDWGHAEDYVQGMWKMLQQKRPDDYVLATGKQYSVKQFINLCSKKLDMLIVWKGKGLNEKGYFNNKVIIEIDLRYFRKLEVENLLGNSLKARKILSWKPKHTIDSLIDDMIKNNFKLNA